MGEGRGKLEGLIGELEASAPASEPAAAEEAPAEEPEAAPGRRSISSLVGEDEGTGDEAIH